MYKRQRYCFLVPEEFPDLQAAPLLCAGLIGYRCLRKLGRHEEARESIASALRVQPYQADYLHEAALVAHADGDDDAARAHLERALEVWREADADFTPAVEARATLTSWRQGS